MPSPARSAAAPKIAAVLVTYQPDGTFLDNLRKLSAQTGKIIVVDNGSTGGPAKLVEAAGRMAGIQLIANGANLGIASALNTGIRRALADGCQWVATFDQDSAIPENYFADFFQAHQACPESRTVGMIVPGSWGHPKTPAAPTVPAWAFVPAAANSGSVIRADVFAAAGFYDGELFIDYVDADFCLKIQGRGFKILSASNVNLGHELGVRQTRRLLGRELSFRIHTYWRYYYIMRNRLLVYRRHARRHARWVMQDAAWMFLELGRMAVLENGRGAKLKAAFRGVLDGLRGKNGRHPDYPPA